jgi:hypothetical protein
MESESIAIRVDKLGLEITGILRLVALPEVVNHNVLHKLDASLLEFGNGGANIICGEDHASGRPNSRVVRTRAIEPNLGLGAGREGEHHPVAVLAPPIRNDIETQSL